MIVRVTLGSAGAFLFDSSFSLFSVVSIDLNHTLYEYSDENLSLMRIELVTSFSY